MSYHRSSVAGIGEGLQAGAKKAIDEAAKAGAKSASKGFWDYFKEGLTPATTVPKTVTPPMPPPARGMPGWVLPVAIGGGALVVLLLVLKR